MGTALIELILMHWNLLRAGFGQFKILANSSAFVEINGAAESEILVEEMSKNYI